MKMKRREYELEILKQLGNMVGTLPSGKIKDLKDMYRSLETIEKAAYVYMRTIKSILEKTLKEQGKV